ncbi:hypothetical protein U1Q18_044677 [Sarracenia purpurea var. burkii]
METSTINPMPSEPLANLELIEENNGDNSDENDFHFGYLTVESSTDPPRCPGYRRPNVFRDNFEGTLVNIGESNVSNDDFEEASNLLLYEKIPSLQMMTSSRVAIALWRRVISLDHSKRKATSWPTFEFVRAEDQNKVCKLIESLPVPRLIRELVENCLSLVRSEMNEWVCYFLQNVFKTKPSDSEDPIKMSDLMFCHWLPNSTIDHRKTALNMLSNPRLSFTDKFKIMCKYCLEDEIMKLPPKSIPKGFIKNITFDKIPLMYYWLCHMNGNSHKLPRKNGLSVECFLIIGFSVDSWSAMEYFWDRLSFNEQVSKSLVLLNQKPQFQKQLISKMNEFQKCHVLSAIPYEITMNFWKRKSQERYAYLTWLRIKDTVTYDQFTKFIYAFLTESLPNNIEKLKYLVKIWNSSPDDFINRGLNSMRNTVIGLHSKHYSDSACNLEFLLTFLSYGSVEYRKAVMFQQGSSLVLYNDFSTIDRLIELYLPDPKDVLKFKNILMNSEIVRRHCCSMLEGQNGDVDQLISFRDHYCPNSSAKTEFLPKILDAWTIGGTGISNHQRWNIVVEFIDRHILNTYPDQAIEFKKRIAWSFVRYCADCWCNSDEFKKFIDFIHRLFDNEELNRFKTSVVGAIPARFRWRGFKKENTQSLLSWCFNNDDQKIKEFKESFPHRQHIRSVDKVKKYKLEKMLGYSYDDRSMFVRQANRIDEEYARMILPWFFDGDEEQIRKFKEKYKDDVISSLIDVE